MDKKINKKNEKQIKSNISDMLEDELKYLRKNQDKLFFNFETNCKVIYFTYKIIYFKFNRELFFFVLIEI